MRKIRILIVTWFYPNQAGYMDFSYRIHALSRVFDTTVISRESLMQGEFDSVTGNFVVLPTLDCSTSSHVGYVLRVASYIRSENHDLVVLLGSQVAAVKLLIGRIPTVVYWNEHPDHYFSSDVRNPIKRTVRWFLRALTYRGAERAEVVMPIGEAHQEDLLAHGVKPASLKLIYMGVDSAFAPQKSSRSGQGAGDAAPLRLIYTGTVIRERGRDVMLEGLAKANANGKVATLTLVGALADQISYCEARAKELGIGDALKVMGRVSGESIPGLLAEADAGICIWEDRLYWRFNPPTKLFEYLVAGLPVLVSNIRTHTAYVRSWENGLVFDYDADDFAAKVQELWMRRTELPRMSECALENSEKYLWSNLERRFLDALPVNIERITS